MYLLYEHIFFLYVLLREISVRLNLPRASQKKTKQKGKTMAKNGHENISDKNRITTLWELFLLTSEGCNIIGGAVFESHINLTKSSGAGSLPPTSFLTVFN